MPRAGGPVPEARPDVTTWTRDAFASTIGVPGVWRTGLALVEGGGRRLRFTASDRGTDAADPEWCHVDAYEDVPLNTAVRTGEPVHGSLAELARRYPDFVEHQDGTATVALAAVPVVAAGQVLGGFVLFFDRSQPFGGAQRRQLARLGEDLGAALRRMQRDHGRPRVDLTDEPMPPGALVAVHHVPPDPAAVAAARRFLRGTLQDWDLGEETTDTAVLCLSELVTNALMHTPDGCALRVVLDRGVLTTTVRDGGRTGLREPEPPDDPLRVHGRGLQVVEALASRWGSELDGVGTTVWFVLEQ